MQVDIFFNHLNAQLLKIEQKYYSSSEGMIYLGFPSIDFSKMSKEERSYFVYYLCFFVAFDLLVFTYNNENYELQKGKLQLPKFEYGLSNVFIYPGAIFEKFKVNSNSEIFENVVELGFAYLNSRVQEIDSLHIFDNIFSDKDFLTGAFNIELKKAIKKYSQK